MLRQLNPLRVGASLAKTRPVAPATLDREGLRSNHIATRRHGPDADTAARPTVARPDRSPAPSTRLRSLLVPLDGSPFAEHALPLAVAIAERAGARLRLVHVYSPLESPHEPAEIVANSGVNYLLRKQQQDYLDDVLERLADITSVRTVSTLLLARETAESLSAEANHGADLVVMATRQRNLLGRWWYGSTTEALMQRLSVPLLIVPGRKTPPDLNYVPPLRRALIALDGSESGEQVLGPAAALCDVMDTELTLFRAVPEGFDHFLASSDLHFLQSHFQERYVEAQDYLDGAARRLDGRTCKTFVHAVRDGRPIAEAILSHAQNRNADLIALATQGRGNGSQLSQRSVAARVAQRASLPILVVRSTPDPATAPGDEQADA